MYSGNDLDLHKMKRETEKINNDSRSTKSDKSKWLEEMESE